MLQFAELDAIIHMGCHENEAGGQSQFYQPDDHSSFDATQNTGCKCTRPAHVQPFNDQFPQVILIRATLNPFITQPELLPGISLNQVLNFAVGLVEPHDVAMNLLLKLFMVPLDDIPSFQCVNCTTQLDVLYKIAVVALNPFVIDKNIKEY